MIEVIKEQFTKDMSDEDKTNRAREFLQILILKIIYDKGWFDHLAFVGGTALRVLFNMRRFSEDLDFSLIKKTGYNFDRLTAQIQKEIELNGLTVEQKNKQETTVHNTFLKFPNLLHKLDLSPLKSQKLSIKFDIDTNPPLGGHLENTLVNKTYLFNVKHFDLPSLFATKIHACFYRKYLKGRDFYDFIWYLSKKTQPNYELLNNAIKQTQGKSPGLTEKNIKEFLLQRVEAIDFRQAAQDVERFLEDKGELKLFSVQTVKQGIQAVF